MTADRGAPAEAVLVAGLGGLAGWLATAWFGLGWFGLAIGAINGGVGGYFGLYDWTRPWGWGSFVLDSTWGLSGTSLGLVCGALNLGRADRGYIDELARRRGYHVFSGGFGLRRDFALALGNVISNAGGSVGLRGESDRVRNRRTFVVEHEGLHVLQSRVFGPLFQLGYVVWAVGGVAVGLVLGASSKGERIAIIETLAYYDNPFEYWAYRNNRYWPPRGAVKRFAWPSPKRSPRTLG